MAWVDTVSANKGLIHKRDGFSILYTASYSFHNTNHDVKAIITNQIISFHADESLLRLYLHHKIMKLSKSLREGLFTIKNLGPSISHQKKSGFFYFGIMRLWNFNFFFLSHSSMNQFWYLPTLGRHKCFLL